jgi:hypothetical protein
MEGVEKPRRIEKDRKTLKSHNDSKGMKDLLKATTMLEKLYTTNEMDDPLMWILEFKRLNREVG